MTVFCEPKPDGPFDLHTNPPSDARHEVCAKCGTSWAHGTLAPTCNSTGTATAVFIPLDQKTFTKGEIVESAGAVEAWQIPSSVLMDPVIRDLGRTEPFFILRASDLLADYLVEVWARNAETNGCDAKKVAAAREKAREFRAFSPRRYPA